jgi:catechol 2,3-dioxygenase-like lactoylglutathione lyase family enzyme
MTSATAIHPNTTQQVSLHLKRPCLLVADLERSLSLYRDLLGFRLDHVGAASADSYLYKVFQIPQQAQLKFAALSTQHEDRALALTEVKAIELPPSSPPHRIAIVLQVDDIALLIPQIQQLGLTVVEPSCFQVLPDRTFTEQGFYDFDNHLIVLYDSKASSDQ